VTPDCELRRFDDAGRLAAALADELAARLTAAVVARGEASLVVPGGRTPLPMFERLRGAALDWSRVTVTLTDERWIDPHDAASNEGLVRRALLQGPASAARFVALKNAAPTAVEGAPEATRALAAIRRPFDIVVLGMGDDGHTASLFPLSPGIQTALDPGAVPGCVATTAPVVPLARLSLNLAALAQARQHILHITGEAKWRVWQAAGGLPIGLTLRQAAARPLLYWSP
jgi:6-phosphogluconolactonase